MKRMLQHKLQKLTAFFILSFYHVFALASVAGLPWENVFDKIIRSLTGPVLFGVTTLIMVLFGIVVAHNEGAQWMKWGARIVFGISIAASGASTAGTLFGVSKGFLV